MSKKEVESSFLVSVWGVFEMNNFYKPDLGSNPDDPFARDADNKLVRRAFWLDMSDRSLVLAMTSGVGAHLPNAQKICHLNDLGRGHLVDDVCVQEILPPEQETLPPEN